MHSPRTAPAESGAPRWTQRSSSTAMRPCAVLNATKARSATRNAKGFCRKALDSHTMYQPGGQSALASVDGISGAMAVTLGNEVCEACWSAVSLRSTCRGPWRRAVKRCRLESWKPASVTQLIGKAPETKTARQSVPSCQEKYRSHMVNHHLTKPGAGHLRRALHQAGKVVGDVLGQDRAAHAVNDQVGGFDPAHVAQHHFGRQDF